MEIVSGAFDFDTIIPRQGTGSLKWEKYEPDVLPLWVADMDFACPEAVSRALVERAAHPIYGYNTQSPALMESIVQWVKRRHHWEIEPEWILLSPGVINSIILSILALSQPGDGVIIQTPIYHPFFPVIRDNEREVAENPLILNNGRYEIDFDQLERTLAGRKNKLLLLCSPHNPVGRVWSRDELKTISELCQKYEVDVLSDEIHCDLVYAGHKHTPFATVASPDSEQCVTFMSASKTFNLPGLNCSYMIIPCRRRRALIDSWLNRLHLRRSNLFGVLATEAAFRHGEKWLDALLPYLNRNAETMADFVRTRLPGVNVIRPEGTYLAWLDFRKHFTSATELDEFLVHKAKVGLNRGTMYGRQGEGFARLNFATPRARLLEALTRIEKALSSR
ncbi:MAG: MalY/PatB family protein [Candidatus Korobacteraceae bacterium]